MTTIFSLSLPRSNKKLLEITNHDLRKLLVIIIELELIVAVGGASGGRGPGMFTCHDIRSFFLSFL